ncbi:hypothetical protein FG93_00002 [Bosea sp. LC85]|nr:hypothetical protein FG93_00002 [Bosea sp. LC85]
MEAEGIGRVHQRVQRHDEDRAVRIRTDLERDKFLINAVGGRAQDVVERDPVRAQPRRLDQCVGVVARELEPARPVRIVGDVQVAEIALHQRDAGAEATLGDLPELRCSGQCGHVVGDGDVDRAGGEVTVDIGRDHADRAERRQIIRIEPGMAVVIAVQSCRDRRHIAGNRQVERHDRRRSVLADDLRARHPRPAQPAAQCRQVGREHDRGDRIRARCEADAVRGGVRTGRRRTARQVLVVQRQRNRSARHRAGAVRHRDRLHCCIGVAIAIGDPIGEARADPGRIGLTRRRIEAPGPIRLETVDAQCRGELIGPGDQHARRERHQHARARQLHMRQRRPVRALRVIRQQIAADRPGRILRNRLTRIVHGVGAVILERELDRRLRNGGNGIVVGVGHRRSDVNEAGNDRRRIIVCGRRRAVDAMSDRFELREPQLARVIDIGGEDLRPRGESISGETTRDAPQDQRICWIRVQMDGEIAVSRSQTTIGTVECPIRDIRRESICDRRAGRQLIRPNRVGEQAGGRRR